VLTRYLNELGVAAAEVKTEYGDDEGVANSGEGEAPGDGDAG